MAWQEINGNFLHVLDNLKQRVGEGVSERAQGSWKREINRPHVDIDSFPILSPLEHCTNDPVLLK